MPDSRQSRKRLRELARIWVDAITYALVLTAVVVVAALVVGIATGGGFVRAKVLLFIAGWVLLGYATVRLWPTSPDDVDSPPNSYGEVVPEAGSTRFQAFVRALPPLRWMQPPPPERRLKAPAKLFLGGLAVLFVSFLMETVFGIA